MSDGALSVGMSLVGSDNSSAIETNATICQEGVEADNEVGDGGDSGSEGDGDIIADFHNDAFVENL